jgi:sensor histidine kinase regulating citrate/malate metabolism
VHLRFADNGADIQAEHIGRLFQRGFSTKVRDASGYGLH